MVLVRRVNKKDTLAATRVALGALRDSSSVFPPLQSMVAALLTVWEMSEVRSLFLIFLNKLPNLNDNRK